MKLLEIYLLMSNRFIRSYGMGKFAAAVMWVLHEVFAMPTHYYICEPNEKEGRKLLAEIMQGGNFGQYDTRNVTLKNRYGEAWALEARASDETRRQLSRGISVGACVQGVSFDMEDTTQMIQN